MSEERVPFVAKAGTGLETSSVAEQIRKGSLQTVFSIIDQRLQIC